MPIRPVVRSSLLGRPLGFVSSSSSSAISSSASASSSHIRTFAASSQCRAAQQQNPLISASLPPESPNFIKYPEPPQAEKVYRAPKRGHLPVPRNVFKVDRKPGQPRTDPSIVPKTDTDAFAARATPLSKAEAAGDAPRSDKEAWRRHMAAARRENLQAGLSGLWTRQQTETQRARARSAYNFERNRAAAMNDQERDDVRLTQSSVRDVTAKQTAVLRDPHRHERQAEMAARTAALAQAKREARRDALLELYQIAGNFIVDEADLEKRVDQIFHPNHFKQEAYSFGMMNAENIWEVNGAPPSITQQMAAITRTEMKIYDSHMSEPDRTTKRQKLVTEALTGGKMP